MLARLPGGVVVASEPYDDDPSWVDVPDGSLLVADPTGVRRASRSADVDNAAGPAPTARPPGTPVGDAGPRCDRLERRRPAQPRHATTSLAPHRHHIPPHPVTETLS